MFGERLATRLLEACVLRGMQQPEAPADAAEALLVYCGVIQPSPEVFDRLIAEYFAAAWAEPLEARWRPAEPAHRVTVPTPVVDGTSRGKQA